MPLNGKHLSINTIIEGLFRDYGFTHEVDWVDILEWSGEALDLIAAPKQYINKVTDGNKDLNHHCPIKIENFRGQLPADVANIIQAREFKHKIPMIGSADNFLSGMQVNSKQLPYSTDSSAIVSTPTIVGLGNTTFSSPLLDITDFTKDGCAIDLQYKINNNHIFTNFKEGEVELSYTALPCDEQGFPLIPDNVKYVQAVKAYVASKIAFKLYIQDKMNNQKLTRIEQERDWYMGAATVAGVSPTIDEMESWKNQWLRLLPSINEHADGFKRHSS